MAIKEEEAMKGIEVVPNPVMDAHRRQGANSSDYVRAFRAEAARGQTALKEAGARRANCTTTTTTTRGRT